MSDFDNMHNPNWERIKEMGLNIQHQEVEDLLNRQKYKSVNPLDTPSFSPAPFASHYNSWSIDLEPDGAGTINASDNDGGAGVRLSGLRDVERLLDCIDHVLETGSSRDFYRDDDSATIKVYRSRQEEGKYVIERAGGNFLRLSAGELRSFRNALDGDT